MTFLANQLSRCVGGCERNVDVCKLFSIYNGGSLFQHDDQVFQLSPVISVENSMAGIAAKKQGSTVIGHGKLLDMFR